MDASEVDRAWEIYRGHERLRELLPGLARSDVESVARYLKHSRWYWERILEGGALGASLLLHELIEIDELHQRDVDPFDPAEQSERWKDAHPAALLAEHDFLLEVARQNGYNLRSILPLVAANPNVTWTERMADVMRAQGKRPGGATRSELRDAEEFYRRLLDGEID